MNQKFDNTTNNCLNVINHLGRFYGDILVSSVFERDLRGDIFRKPTFNSPRKHHTLKVFIRLTVLIYIYISFLNSPKVSISH